MKLISRLSKLVRQIRGLLPSALPTGISEFDTWADSIRSTYRMPTEDRDSTLWALGNIIAHLGPSVAYKPKYYFALVLHASASKQVAFHISQEVRKREKERLEQSKQEATNKAGLSVVEPPTSA